MAYGTLKVDNITYTSGGSDASTSVSGIVSLAAGNFNNITATGTISGVTITGTTGQFVTLTAVTGIFTTTLSGAAITGGTAGFTTITGTTITGGTAGFTTVTGTTITGGTVNAVSGRFTTQVSGLKVIAGSSGVVFSDGTTQTTKGVSLGLVVGLS